jgi:hypothetical protein
VVSVDNNLAIALHHAPLTIIQQAELSDAQCRARPRKSRLLQIDCPMFVSLALNF